MVTTEYAIMNTESLMHTLISEEEAEKLSLIHSVAERETTEIMYRHATLWSPVAAVDKLEQTTINNEHVISVLQKVLRGEHSAQEVQQLITHFASE